MAIEKIYGQSNAWRVILYKLRIVVLWHYRMWEEGRYDQQYLATGFGLPRPVGEQMRMVVWKERAEPIEVFDPVRCILWKPGEQVNAMDTSSSQVS